MIVFLPRYLDKEIVFIRIFGVYFFIMKIRFKEILFI